MQSAYQLQNKNQGSKLIGRLLKHQLYNLCGWGVRAVGLQLHLQDAFKNSYIKHILYYSQMWNGIYIAEEPIAENIPRSYRKTKFTFALQTLCVWLFDL